MSDFDEYDDIDDVPVAGESKPSTHQHVSPEMLDKFKNKLRLQF